MPQISTAKRAVDRHNAKTVESCIDKDEHLFDDESFFSFSFS
ncbi:889_t:CDS:2 [Entrophospora sp. SA101]|nr:889_t:CDS:2 [Entrophospora sp. SA101]